MRRIRLVVSYDGTAYCGSQVQPNGVTIEEKLNEAVMKLTGEASPVIFASRTDSGVHALGNVAVFDTEMRMAADKFTFALNQRLPEDIRIRASEEVPADWHPRKQNCRKTYDYRIYNNKVPDPLLRLYSQYCYYDLDTERMRQAVRCLTGEHDFNCFCSARSQAENTVRTIYSIDILEDAVPAGGKLVTIRISGSGFLYNMVRIIAGTLLQIGSGIRPPEDMERILRSRDRKNAGPVAGASGLTLVSIGFQEELEDRISVENEDWSYCLDQQELKDGADRENVTDGKAGPDGKAGIDGKTGPAGETGPDGKAGPAAYLTVHRCADRDYAELLTRLFHQNYRNGAAFTFVRDLERPERLAGGQKYGFYTLEAAEGEYPWRASDKGH